MIDDSLPARFWIGRTRAATLGGLLLVSLALTFLLSSPARAGSLFATSPLAISHARVYVPAVFAGTDTPDQARRLYLPIVYNQPASPYQCPTTSTAAWDSMRPRQSFISGAATSPDLNINVRGWFTVDEFLGFVRYSYLPAEPPDTLHPLHLSAVTGGGAAGFVSTYQINEWDWECNCSKPRTRSPYTVTMLGLRTTPGQPLHMPSRDLRVDPRGFTAMVLYADAGQLALKYTWEDRVDTGYLVHLLNLCVDPGLVRLYEELDSAGRLRLPGVHNSSVVGVALGGEVRVVVRDTGSFLDPRSWQDWWQDQPQPAAW